MSNPTTATTIINPNGQTPQNITNTLGAQKEKQKRRKLMIIVLPQSQPVEKEIIANIPGEFCLLKQPEISSITFPSSPEIFFELPNKADFMYNGFSGGGMGLNSVPDADDAVQQNSRTDIFGPAIFVSPRAVHRPLMINIVEEILSQLRFFLPDKNGKFRDSLLGTRSYFIWEPDYESDQYLHNIIMPGIFRDPSVSKIRTFSLTVDSLMKMMKDGCTLLEATKGIIKQAVDLNEPCILYIPGISKLNDGILGWTNETFSTFISQLQAISNTNVLLVATDSGPLTNISKEVRTLYMGYKNVFQMRKPTELERKQFFRQIFGDLIDLNEERSKRARMDGASARVHVSRTETFEKYLIRAVQITDGHPCDFLLKLFDALQGHKDECTTDGVVDFEKLGKEHEELLDQYDQTQLN